MGLFNDVQDAATATAKGILGAARDTAAVTAKGLNAVGGGIFNLVGRLAGGAANTGIGIAKAVTKNVDTAALGSAVKGIAGNIISGVGNWSKSVLVSTLGEEKANEKIEGARKGFEGFRNFVGSVGRSVAEIASPVTGSIRSGFEAATSAFNARQQHTALHVDLGPLSEAIAGYDSPDERADVSGSRPSEEAVELSAAPSAEDARDDFEYT